MYRILHENGQQYGPVSQEQIRLWIGQGRVNAATLICADGSMDWRALGGWPEFRHFVAPSAFPPATAPVYRGARQTNGWAIWGFICGLLSLTLCSCCCLPLDLLGIVFSIIALIQISNHPHTQSGNTLAILGLVLSVLSFVLGFAFSALWLSTGAGEEFMRELDRGFRLGAAQRLNVQW